MCHACMYLRKGTSGSLAMVKTAEAPAWCPLLNTKQWGYLIHANEHAHWLRLPLTLVADVWLLTFTSHCTASVTEGDCTVQVHLPSSSQYSHVTCQ